MRRFLKKIREFIFAETDDKGKVNQIKWSSTTHGSAMLHVPVKAFKRYAKRATLRALKLKVPTARKIHIIQEKYCTVRSQTTSYYLVRIHFSRKAPVTTK